MFSIKFNLILLTFTILVTYFISDNGLSSKAVLIVNEEKKKYEKIYLNKNLVEDILINNEFFERFPFRKNCEKIVSKFYTISFYNFINDNNIFSRYKDYKNSLNIECDINKKLIFVYIKNLENPNVFLSFLLENYNAYHNKNSFENVKLLKDEIKKNKIVDINNHLYSLLIEKELKNDLINRGLLVDFNILIGPELVYSNKVNFFYQLVFFYLIFYLIIYVLNNVYKVIYEKFHFRVK